MGGINNCTKCIYSRLGECFYYPLKIRYKDIMKIVEDSNNLKEELNKNNECQFFIKRNLMFYIKFFIGIE